MTSPPILCWKCGGEIPPGGKFDLIHASGLPRPVHAPGEGCNPPAGAVLVHLATDDRERILCTGEPWPASRGEHPAGTLLRQCPDCHREATRAMN